MIGKKNRVRALSIAVLTLAASACRRSPRVAVPEQSLQTFVNLSLNQTHLGHAIWNLKAAEAVLDKDHDIAHLSSPQMRFYKNDRIASTLTADSGLLYTQTQNVHMEGHVVGNSLADKTVLHTDALDYVSQTKKFVTHEKVAIFRPSGVSHGDGLEANSDFSQITIFHQRSVIQGKEGNN